jgi:hypothetical protein
VVALRPFPPTGRRYLDDQKLRITAAASPRRICTWVHTCPLRFSSSSTAPRSLRYVFLFILSFGRNRP